jgi:hypothetical protein
VISTAQKGYVRRSEITFTENAVMKRSPAAA